MNVLPVPVGPVMTTLWCSVIQRPVASCRSRAWSSGARGAVVDGLEAGLREAEPGLLERPLQAAVLPREPLGVDEQAEAFVEGERVVVGAALLFLPRGGHGIESQGGELLVGRGVEHAMVPPQL